MYVLLSYYRLWSTSLLRILPVQALEESGIRTGLVSNCDARMRARYLLF